MPDLLEPLYLLLYFTKASLADCLFDIRQNVVPNLKFRSPGILSLTNSCISLLKTIDYVVSTYDYYCRTVLVFE